jgi:uncharacterized membrane protein
MARGALGGAMIGLGASRRGMVGFVLRALGAGLAAATISPAASRALREAGERRRWVNVRRVFFVALPVRDVFAFFRDFENFRSVLTDVESVVDFDDGRSRWTVRTRGEPLTWDAVITKWVPNTVIGWRNVDSSPVLSTGLIRFAPAVQNDVEGTCVEFELCYRPTADGFRDTVEGLVSPRPPARVARDLDRLPHTLRARSTGAKLASRVQPESPQG